VCGAFLVCKVSSLSGVQDRLCVGRLYSISKCFRGLNVASHCTQPVSLRSNLGNSVGEVQRGFGAVASNGAYFALYKFNMQACIKHLQLQISKHHVA
jgi:hypothetical protein